MLRFIICEDNKDFLNRLSTIINKVMMPYNFEYKVNKFTEYNKDVEEIIKRKHEQKVYVLDIELSEVSGLEIASEILASAIKESYKGIIVGTNSFGKGTVQKTKKLSDGSMIKYTVQKWLTPNGNWIDEVGVTPTNFVELRTANEKEITIGEDRQLETAKNLLFEKIN